MMKATKEDSEAVTAVFWDIKRCPVPPGYDARRVGPCVERLLENLGYFGPRTITAVGILTQVPGDVLRAVASSGIALDHVACDIKSFVTAIYMWSWKNPPPANLMVISPFFTSLVGELSLQGYNVLRLFPFDPSVFASTNAERLWNNFLMEGALEEDKCSYMIESVPWVCSVCLGVAGQGFEIFTAHLSTPEHESHMLMWSPAKPRSSAPSESHEKNKKKKKKK